MKVATIPGVSDKEEGLATSRGELTTPASASEP